MQESLEKQLKAFSSTLPLGCFKKLVFFPIISSTNQKAKELAYAGQPEGTIVVAEQQSKGRGRFNRAWESPKGGLYFSFILQPQVSVDKASLLPLVTALAVAKTMSKYGVSVQIKWPNDIHSHGKKIAGILLESEIQKDVLRFVIIGVGINVNTKTFSSELTEKATSVLREIRRPVVLVSVLQDFLREFDRYYHFFLDGVYTHICDEWKENSDTLGKQVCVSHGALEITGTAVDIDEGGFLIVRTDQGEIKKISSGDCFYIQGV